MPTRFDRPRSTHFAWSIFCYIPQLSLVLVFALLATLLAFLVQVAQAAAIIVTTTADALNADGDCSLREAIRAANLNSSIDACAAGNGAEIDQRGVLRPQDGNANGTARCDIGAYERQASSTYVVVSVAASCTYDNMPTRIPSSPVLHW